MIGFAGSRGKIPLGDEHRHIGGNAVLAPDLNDVAHELGFIVKTSSTEFCKDRRDSARRRRMPDLRSRSVLLEIVDETRRSRRLCR